jgi:hypothetical protein
MYDNANPQNIVFDVNVTNLFYAEPDTFREEGIDFIINYWAPPLASSTASSGTVLKTLWALRFFIAGSGLWLLI